jgi:hypothetical protein
LPSIDVYSAYPSGWWRQRRGWAIENTGRQPQTQHIQAFYPVSVTLVEEPWEYLSMEDKENDKPTMIERSITGI